MAPYVRTALAILGGVLLAGLTIALIEMLGHGLAVTNPAMPFVAALVGYALGGGIGAGLAARLAAHPRPAAWTVIAVLAALALVNLFALAHPWWFAPAAAIIFALTGWLLTRRAAT